MVTHIRHYWHIYILSFLVFLAGFVWYEVVHTAHHDLRFVMMDIGQGDALYIEAPNGNNIIIDGGPGDALLGQLGKVMSVTDRHVDMIMNTNPDLDHFEGFIPLLDRYSVGAFMVAGTDAETNPLWRTLEKKIVEHKIPTITAMRGQRIDMGDGVYIDILFPDRDVSGLTHNDGSIVARLTYGKTSIMLTGDSTQKVEKYLVSIYPQSDLQSNIFKSDHHGSKTSNSEIFVRTVNPDVALISAGKGNSYGLPSPETLATFDKLKIPYLITFNEGPIEYDSDGVKFVRVK
jgi:competence protein ComEC